MAKQPMIFFQISTIKLNFQCVHLGMYCISTFSSSPSSFPGILLFAHECFSLPFEAQIYSYLHGTYWIQEDFLLNNFLSLFYFIMFLPYFVTKMISKATYNNKSNQ